MKISVVISTYNRPALIRRCIDALVVQEFPKDEYEIIVVSDGPDALTQNIVEDAQAKTKMPAITFYSLTKRSGPAAARNKGWMSARGSLIAFSDDDCIPDVYWLRSAWDAYKMEKYIAFTGNVVCPCPDQPTDYERNVSRLATADFVTANCFCTRGALERVNGFDTRFSRAWREDSDLQFKLLRYQVPIRHLPNATVIHPIRPAHWGVSLKEQRKSLFNALLYKKHTKLYKRKIQSGPPWHYYLMVASFFVFLINLLLIHSSVLGWLSSAVFLFLMIRFIIHRLNGNSLNRKHVLEMVATSLVIPFLSVFWRLYGAVKFKVLFL